MYASGVIFMRDKGCSVITSRVPNNIGQPMTCNLSDINHQRLLLTVNKCCNCAKHSPLLIQCTNV